MGWSWEFIWEILPTLFNGLKITFILTLLGSVIAVPLGAIFALLRMSQYPGLSQATGLFVEFLRGTPFLVQIYFLFYVFPQFGITLEAMVIGVLSLALYFGAYMSEIYRSAIEAVPTGQWEASLTLGFPLQRMWLIVVMPQALKIALPMLGNYVLVMFKETALLSTITVMELLSRGMDVAFMQFRYAEPLTLVAVFYLVIGLPITRALRRMESRIV